MENFLPPCSPLHFPNDLCFFFFLNTCPGCLVWVKHEPAGAHLTMLPAQRILLLIVMQSVIFTCY